MRRLALLFLLPMLAANGSAPFVLDVEVEGMRNHRGQIHACLTRNRSHFPDCRQDPEALKDLRLGLVESSEGKIGSATDKFLLMCYDYDPATGKYSKLAFNVVRLGGAVNGTGGGVNRPVFADLDRRPFTASSRYVEQLLHAVY